jgi:hypothetical protein
MSNKNTTTKKKQFFVCDRYIIFQIFVLIYRQEQTSFPKGVQILEPCIEY